MDNILEEIKKDKFARYIGVEILEAKDGTAVGRLKTDEIHLNALGTVQGGAIFTLADTTLAAASNSRPGTCISTNVTITYCNAAALGTLIARAKEVSLNRKLATYLIEVTDEQQKMIALFQGTVYRKAE